MDERLDVLTVADMCVDLIVRGNVRPRFHQVEQLVDSYQVELGGSANIFASQYVRLGGSAGVVGWVGRDPFGDYVLSRLCELGVDHRHVRRHPTLRTGLGVALVEPNDRAILTYLGTIDAVGSESLTGELITMCRHWHIASYFLLSRLRDSWPAFLRQLRDAGITISLDTSWDPDERWEGVLELLPFVDLFFPNEAEALAISGQSEMDTAGRALAACGPMVVVKRGEKGASVFLGVDRWDLPVRDEQLRVVDSIGAGDNFDAGFLRAWRLGQSIDQCLALGARCARASLLCAGGIAGQWRDE